MAEFTSDAAEEAAAGLSDEQLEAIEGSGADGKIKKSDVEDYLASLGDGDSAADESAGEKIDSLKGVKRSSLVVLEPLTHDGEIHEPGEPVPEYLTDEQLEVLVHQGAVGKK